MSAAAAFSIVLILDARAVREPQELVACSYPLHANSQDAQTGSAVESACSTYSEAQWHYERR